MVKKKQKIDRIKGIFYLFVVFVVAAIGIFIVVFLWGGSDTRGQTNLLAANYDSCSDVDFTNMPVLKTDLDVGLCSSWTIEKSVGHYKVGCDYESGDFRAYGIVPVNVSGEDSVRIKADLSTTSSIIHYDDYVDMVVFTEDKTPELSTCGGTSTSEGWATTCALQDRTTDSLGHCGLPKYTLNKSCDLTVDVSGRDMIYLTFIGADAWAAAFGPLKDSFDNVQVCTAGDGSEVSEDDYTVSLIKDDYDESDSNLQINFEFPEGLEQTLMIDVKNEDGGYVSSTSSDWNLHIYPSDTSPKVFTPPIEWTESGTYAISATVVKWDEDVETTVYEDSLSFDYSGGNTIVCGDAVCSENETCSADNCCGGIQKDTDADKSNCGICGNVCALDYECQSGICVDVGDYDDDNACQVEGCERAKECALALAPLEGCFVEILDVIPVLDKPAAVSLLGDDLCSLKERYELNDPIGMGITSALMAIDFADNAVDFTIVGYGITIASDIVEGAIDCAEGILYEAVKMCGGYMSCMGDIIRGIQAVTNGGILAVRALSPVELSVQDDYGNPIQNALVVNRSDLKFVLVFNPDEENVNVKVTGIESGAYGLETIVYNESGEIKFQETEADLTIVAGQEDTYSVSVSSNYDTSGIDMAQVSSVMPTVFSDLSGHWAESYVMSLVNKGIVGGYLDGTFRPDQTITRAELLKIALEAFEDILLQTLGVTISPQENTFYDVSSNDWFYNYVTFAAYHQMVSGYGDGNFKPNKNVTRAEAMKIIALATGFDLPLEVPDSIFSDVPNDAWYKYFVMLFAGGGRPVSGYSDGTFRPNQSITRAEASKIIKAVKDALGGGGGGAGIEGGVEM